MSTATARHAAKDHWHRARAWWVLGDHDIFEPGRNGRGGLETRFWFCKRQSRLMESSNVVDNQKRKRVLIGSYLPHCGCSDIDIPDDRKKRRSDMNRICHLIIQGQPPPAADTMTQARHGRLNTYMYPYWTCVTDNAVYDDDHEKQKAHDVPPPS